jgi:hypothetical protein
VRKEICADQQKFTMTNLIGPVLHISDSRPSGYHPRFPAEDTGKWADGCFDHDTKLRCENYVYFPSELKYEKGAELILTFLNYHYKTNSGGYSICFIYNRLTRFSSKSLSHHVTAFASTNPTPPSILKIDVTETCSIATRRGALPYLVLGYFLRL